jgi:carboxymethylenebutenolidase
VSEGHFQSLMARDGHTFNAYLVKPAGAARGAVVILQEIFGLTAHICGIADSYAADGYLAIAPALFDRVRRNLVLGYSPQEFEQARGYRLQIPVEKVLLDITASTAVVSHAGRVAAIGFCWGGTLAWLAASRVKLSAAVCYYGAKIFENAQQTPQKIPLCPTQLHFGEHDASIPAAEIQQLRKIYPQGDYHLYPADHAFANEDRPDSYNAQAAALARANTNAFLAAHVG